MCDVIKIVHNTHRHVLTFSSSHERLSSGDRRSGGCDPSVPRLLENHDRFLGRYAVVVESAVRLFQRGAMVSLEGCCPTLVG